MLDTHKLRIKGNSASDGLILARQDVILQHVRLIAQELSEAAITQLPYQGLLSVHKGKVINE